MKKITIKDHSQHYVAWEWAVERLRSGSRFFYGNGVNYFIGFPLIIYFLKPKQLDWDPHEVLSNQSLTLHFLHRQ